MTVIRIMTGDFQLLGETNRYESLQITRSWHGVGVLEMRINRYKQHADKLLRGSIVFPHNSMNKAYQIKHREIELDENGKATENWIIRALSLKSWFGQRLTFPPTSTGYDNKQADAETVMQHYVTNNIISPVDGGRRMGGVVLSPNQKRGDNVNWQSRYKNLAQEIGEISLLSGLGWNVKIDPDAKEFVFEVLGGKDLTARQTLLPPAVFSPEFNTLGQLTYTESELNFKNYAVVAGQGEGVDRRVIHVGDATGFDRYELFVDARDVAEETDHDDPMPRAIADIEADLINRGQQKLKEHEQEVYLEGQVLSKSRLTYEIDYNLGDIVTLQNREWGVTLDARITSIKEIYEPNKVDIELTFGNDRPTLISKIKQELSAIHSEIRK